ncbi:glycerophosphodiester phosphodiesterase [Brevibacterium otitidis]|uniref:Glycerophosphodiester phosphodiesterase n=1 Tax=Brevibacterium otitidis TaxID=53364 RepID=A0ABV5WZ80_9MICO|nr:glycerophosphodiester phosphodiesterase family protein [Brevibacterium otitidis]
MLEQFLADHGYEHTPGGESKPWVIAHRGYSGAAPENTLAAIEAARVIGAEWIEIDIGISAAGTPIVLHDTTLGRTTTMSGTASQMSDERISLADAGSWMGPGFIGQRVPKLRTVLSNLADFEGNLLLEFKDDWAPGAIAQVTDDIMATGMADRLILQSFSPKTLTILRDLIPMVARGLLRMVPRPEDKTLAAELDVTFYNPSRRGFFLRQPLLEEFMTEGYGCFVWTSNSPADWERLMAAGVHGIITDHPGRLQGYLAAKYDAD